MGSPDCKVTDLENKIIDLNSEAWRLKYFDIQKAIEINNTAYKISLETSNINFIMQTRVIKAVCNFLDNSNSNNIEEEFNLLFVFFEKFDDKKFLAIILDYQAKILLNFNLIEKSLEKAELSAKISKNNKLMELEAEAVTTLANIYRKLQKFETALKLYKKALCIRQNIKDSFAIASSLNLIARTYTEFNNQELALQFYNEALELRIKINDPALPFTYIGLATIFELREEYSLAKEMYLKVCNINFQYLNDKLSNYLAFYGLGIVSLKINDFENALNYINKAINFAYLTNSKINISNIHLLFSQYYEKVGDTKNALENFKIHHNIETENSNNQINQLKNIDLKKKFRELESKNHEILQSIQYAKRIQKAILPSGDHIETILPARFILYKPKSIVSGDFYWLNKFDNKIVIVAADCTGHGVPGAFMSMLGVVLLNEIITKSEILFADKILNSLRQKVKNALNQKGDFNEQQDGMDMVMCILDLIEMKMQFAGAHNSIFMVRNNQIIEYKGDKMPIGVYFKEKNFTNNIIEIKKNDIYYLSTDGYYDQIGGEFGKKFMLKNFKNLLLQIHNQNLEEQRQILDNKIENWKSFPNSNSELYEQTDDIMVIGIKI
jgi:serine phosphatase RsbU (regulator of sigma subunit)